MQGANRFGKSTAARIPGPQLPYGTQFVEARATRRGFSFGQRFFESQLTWRRLGFVIMFSQGFNAFIPKTSP
jgi:hypothetical protein